MREMAEKRRLMPHAGEEKYRILSYWTLPIFPDCLTTRANVTNYSGFMQSQEK